MSAPIAAVSCWKCGCLFDIVRAGWCEGHRARNEMPQAVRLAAQGILDPRPYTRERCKLCPLGHALHDRPDWWKLPVREPTSPEREAGFVWVLESVPELAEAAE